METDYKSKLFVCWGIYPPNLASQESLSSEIKKKEHKIENRKKRKINNKKEN